MLIHKDHKHESLAACAQRLVDRAHKCSITPDFLSPFACEARSHGLDVKGVFKFIVFISYLYLM